MRTLGIALALAAALAGCAKEKAAEAPVRPVLALQVRAGAAEARDVYAGEVRARHEADVGFRVGGKLVARYVDAGARVHKGQVLARLDPQDARLAATAARAHLAAAQSDYALAQADLARHRDLLEKRFISASAFDAKQNAYNAAAGRLEQARAQAAISGNQESYTTLTADADGVVVSVAAEPAQVLAPGQAVLRLARAGEKEIVIHAPESQVARFKVGQEVGVSLWTDPARQFAGSVREVAGGADPVTRTYLVRVAAPAAPEGARLGMSANVHLRTAPGGAAIVVPLAALTRGSGEPAVWVLDQATQRVEPRAVTVAQYREDGAAISAGLADGEWIVAAGVHKLRPGQPVRIAQAAPRNLETAGNP